MKKNLPSLLTSWFVVATAFAEPLRLHPDNSHYFLWQGKPLALITSAEHYGALVNLDFDYRRYLDALSEGGMNYTRVFVGAYVEPEGAFNIERNTLAPLPERFICPWKRSGQAGYANGGNRFDLSLWDSDYFDRLNDFMSHAAKRNVIVEVTLFCTMYEEKQWKLSPMNGRNNVNGVGDIDRTHVYNRDKNRDLQAVQEKLVRKLVDELNGFDNFFFEICNEPYFQGVTLDWQHRIVDVIVEAERSLPKRHLIAQNIANNSAKVTDPHPAVSIFNFHYATPPDTVAMNWDLNRVIGDDETGFRGTGDAAYRMEAWDFIMAGGGLYNNLDYSFAAGFEDGTFNYPPTQPGGGNPGFRKQIRVLSEFFHALPFLGMQADNRIIRGGIPAGGTARALVEPEGRNIAIYVRNEGSTGPWSARWTGFIVPPVSGEYQFHTYSNDGIRLWVGGEKIVEDWTDHGEKEDTGRIQLMAGRSVPVKLEYFYNGGQGASKLWWTPPGREKEPVPANALRLPDKGWGLRGEYFLGTDLARPLGQRDDGQINFAWGIKPPFSGETNAGDTELQLALPSGTWLAEWVDTKTGEIAKEKRVEGGGVRGLIAPSFQGDIALKLQRVR